jgi:Ca-activated chloride channel family protein
MKPAFVSSIVPLLLLMPAGQGRQQVIVTGRITSAQNRAGLEGANVYSREAGVSVGTDSAGRYRLVLPTTWRDREFVLHARSIGFKPESRTLRLTSDSTTVDFALTVDMNRLSEVVVTGVTGAAEVKKLGFTVTKVPEGTPPAPSATSPAIVLRGNASVALAPPEPGRRHHVDPGFNTESYDRIVDNPFLRARDNPLSTFSIDVDRASYSNMRRFVSMGTLPPKDAVRIEELVNYFAYDYPEPDGREPFSVTTEVARAPWHEDHMLVRVGLQARRTASYKMPPSNLVFLIDVSGSMHPDNKLPLVKDAFRLLVRQLREQDRVAIVVYAGAAGLVLPPTTGDRKSEILGALDRLQAGGSTAGGAGLKLAYHVARESYIDGGNNRVILATDGDFNVGESSDADMERLIEDKRKQGTFLSVLGFGMGNYKDSKMETIADKGNGNYAYIDNLNEARKVLVEEMAGTLLTVAKDVKVQVEFNPARVASYRLLGYENRMLRKEDFDDDRKDAGEIGAGHSVTALYEIEPVRSRRDDRAVEDLRYQRPPQQAESARGDELMYVKLRYKEPDGGTSRLFDHVVRAPRRGRTPEASADLRFAAAVASFGMILRDSEYRGRATLDGVLALAGDALGSDDGGHRAEFVRLVRTVRDRGILAARERQE